jgi:hypothetical protein
MERHVAAMRLDELFRQREAQADRRLLRGPPLRRPVKAIENSRLIGRVDASATVRNHDHRLIAVPIRMEKHPTATIGIKQTVAQHVAQGLPQPSAITRDRADRPVDFDGQVDILLPREISSAFGSLQTELSEIELIFRQEQAPHVALREVEHVVDQGAETADAVENCCDIFGCGRLQLACISGREHLRKAADRGQRRAKFVAHVRNEGGLEPVGFLERIGPFANRAEADLFLSIHANASRNSQAHGVETYFLNFATNPDAEAVAARENAGASGTMHKLPEIVRAITLNNKINESRDGW